jgi:hypothetical protein
LPLRRVAIGDPVKASLIVYQTKIGGLSVITSVYRWAARQ